MKKAPKKPRMASDAPHAALLPHLLAMCRVSSLLSLPRDARRALDVVCAMYDEAAAAPTPDDATSAAAPPSIIQSRMALALAPANPATATVVAARARKTSCVPPQSPQPQSSKPQGTNRMVVATPTLKQTQPPPTRAPVSPAPTARTGVARASVRPATPASPVRSVSPSKPTLAVCAASPKRRPVAQVSPLPRPSAASPTCPASQVSPVARPKAFLRRGSGAAASPALNRTRKTTMTPTSPPIAMTHGQASTLRSPKQLTDTTATTPRQPQPLSPLNRVKEASPVVVAKKSSLPEQRKRDSRATTTVPVKAQEPKPKLKTPERKGKPEQNQKPNVAMVTLEQQQEQKQEQEQKPALAPEQPPQEQRSVIWQMIDDARAKEVTKRIRNARWSVDTETHYKANVTAAVTQTLDRVRTALASTSTGTGVNTDTGAGTTTKTSPTDTSTSTSGAEFSTVAPVLAACGLVEVRTPGTGNCQSMAIIEAATQRTFAAVESMPAEYYGVAGLEYAVRALKSAESAVADRDFSSDHPTEFVTAQVYEVFPDDDDDILTVDTSDAAQCAALIKKSYTAIGESPSDRHSILEPRLWGNSLTLAQATKVLGRPIHVLSESFGKVSYLRVSERPAGQHNAGTGTNTCTPTTVSQSFLSFADWAKQYHTDLEASTSTSAMDTTGSETRPVVVVLRHGNHYNAVLMEPMSGTEDAAMRW